MFSGNIARPVRGVSKPGCEALVTPKSTGLIKVPLFGRFCSTILKFASSMPKASFRWFPPYCLSKRSR